MGRLIPDEFPLSQLKNDSERVVVEAFVDGLSDDWLILPDVSMTGKRDRQADIVLVHERDGVAVVEVKGHVPSIRGGLWMANGVRMDPQPFDQAKDNAYALRDRLRAAHQTLTHLHVEYGVAFPNGSEIKGDLDPGVAQAQVLTSTSLDDVRKAIDSLMTYRHGNARLGSESVEAIVRTLRPDADFSWDPETRARQTRARLEQTCANHVRALERLDANRRVVVTGAAGTGKTRLAMAWALRAHLRGERVLLTCYNVPLADAIAARLPESDRLTVGALFPVMRGLEGMPLLEDGDIYDPDFWDLTVVGHLHRYWSRVTQQFDTVIIDEAQDLSPAWLAQLAQLLDPAGPRRVLMVADENQVLFQRGFSLPAADDGWTRCELASNCRNTYEIARLVRDRLGGAPPPVRGSESDCIRWLQADTLEDAIEHVGAEVDRLIDADGLNPDRVLFATFSSSVRDAIREALAMVDWESRTSSTLTCENVQRIKGLEYDYVVLVAGPDDRVKDELLYVGCTRAISGLSIVGPAAVGARLGLG